MTASGWAVVVTMLGAELLATGTIDPFTGVWFPSGSITGIGDGVVMLIGGNVAILWMIGDPDIPTALELDDMTDVGRLVGVVTGVDVIPDEGVDVGLIAGIDGIIGVDGIIGIDVIIGADVMAGIGDIMGIAAIPDIIARPSSVSTEMDGFRFDRRASARQPFLN